MVLKLDMIQTVAICLTMLFVGKGIKKKISFLEKFCIPAPVIGGFLFAILHLVLRSYGILEFEMDTTLQSPFMMVFFTSIGLTAGIETLKKGGLGVLLFFGVAVTLAACQDAIGVGLANLLGESTSFGLLCGSITMIGGHATAGVWGNVFEEAGLVGATEIGMAAATFGLTMGSLIGGPIGGWLIRKNNLKSKANEEEKIEVDLQIERERIDFTEVLKTLCIIFISIGIGGVIQKLIQVRFPKLVLPAYVTAMVVAGIYRNTIGKSKTKFKVNAACSELLGEVGLSVFLAMALCTLKLWQLYAVAGSMAIILIAQTLVMAGFAILITYLIMGRDYDAAVLSAGICGFGMGATANGVANMSSVVDKYGPSKKAFFILPIVGAFLIDISNTFIITIFASLF